MRNQLSASLLVVAVLALAAPGFSADSIEEKASSECEMTIRLRNPEERIAWYASLARVEREWREKVSAGEGLVSELEDPAASIDTVSLECLACHDGQIGREHALLVRNDRYGRGEGAAYGMSHPIGMDYRRYASMDGKLVPEQGLNPKLRLVAGKVGCISCHDPVAGGKRQLTVSNNGSGLCMGCHIV